MGGVLARVAAFFPQRKCMRKPLGAGPHSDLPWIRALNGNIHLHEISTAASNSISSSASVGARNGAVRHVRQAVAVRLSS